MLVDKFRHFLRKKIEYLNLKTFISPLFLGVPFLIYPNINLNSNYVLASLNNNQEKNAVNAGAIKPWLSIDQNGNLMRNGKPYRGIGVNYFDGFIRSLSNENDSSYILGFKYLHSMNIPFIRVPINGFYPSGYKLYLTNKARYFFLLDKFVHAAEANNIGLIPDLFWNYETVCDVVGEHANQWGNVNSKTMAFMKAYTSDIVKRYKNSPAIWGWEFSNETNTMVDLLDQGYKFRPGVAVREGTPAERDQRDDRTSNIVHTALIQFATAVRLNDKERIIFSGNGMTNQNAYHRYFNKTWKRDSIYQYTKMLDIQNPVELGTISIHLYSDHENKFFAEYKADYEQIIKESIKSAKKLKRVLFVGEFGIPKNIIGYSSETKFTDELDAIVKNKVPLAALWVFDFSYQNSSYNVTSSNDRQYQIKLISKANLQIRKELSSN